MKLVPPSVGQHFAFAQGRIGVIKQVLLSQSDVDRLLGAHDRKGVEQIFTELKITNGIDQSVKNGDAILIAVARWMRNEVENMTPVSKQAIFNILWLEGDAPCIAYLLKKHHGLVSDISEEPVPSFSAYNVEQLRAFVEREETVELPSHVVALVERVKAMENPSPKQIDTEVAQYVADTRLRLARTSGSKDILLYVKHLIDCSNLRTALRLRDEDASEVLPYLLQGGTIKVQELAKSQTDILKAMKKSGLSYRLSDLLEKPEIDVNAIEQALTYIVSEDIARMWNVPLSIEPLFAFAAITTMQLKLMRMILMGKRNELTPQEIKAALPPFISASHYVL